MRRRRATAAVGGLRRTAGAVPPATGGRRTARRSVRAVFRGAFLALALASLPVLAEVWLLPDVQARAATRPSPVKPYATAPGARPVSGTATGADAPVLRPGTYLDTISAGERKHYRIELDATSSAYVSAVLAPPPGSRVAGADGIRIGLTSADGTACSDGTDLTFGGTTPRPVADYATRRTGPGHPCQEAGRYHYTVEWLGTPAGTPGDRRARNWPVEITFLAEPGLRDGRTPPAPADPDRRPPAPPVGIPRTAAGGTGFNDAGTIGGGTWLDRIAPGESRFYRVPVDWGEQLSLKALPESTGGAGGDALRLALFNTARGFVAGADAATDPDSGDTTPSAALTTAPVAYGNRTSAQAETGAMRMAGWYYIRLTLDERAAAPLPVHLRVLLSGEVQPPPAYTADPSAAGFGVSRADRLMAGTAGGGSANGSGDGPDPAMRALGIAGITTGTLLLLTLGLWTRLSRRRPPPPTPW
jgi:hypothetical protein